MNENLSKPTNDSIDKKLVDMNALDKYDELIKDYIKDYVEENACNIATQEQAGVVKTSEEITVKSDGSLTINQVSIDKLVTETDDVIILGNVDLSELL